MGASLSRKTLENGFGIVDAPELARDRVEDILERHNVLLIDDWVGSSEKIDPDNAVCLVLDSFTGSYETEILNAAIVVLKSLGLTVLATPILRNGKALHVRGYLKAFSKTCDQTIDQLNELASLTIPLVGLEPSVLELFRREYRESSKPIHYEVQSLDQFLISQQDRLMKHISSEERQRYQLFLHCTEKTADPATASRWQSIFAAAGQTLEPIKTGCCGMAGLFGHEREHQTMSKQLFDMSWRAPVQAAIQEPTVTPIATGFSCRSQTKRLMGQRPQHPIEALLNLVSRSVNEAQLKEPMSHV
jgi:Fe-S oxidoreductase